MTGTGAGDAATQTLRTPRLDSDLPRLRHPGLGRPPSPPSRNLFGVGHRAQTPPEVGGTRFRRDAGPRLRLFRRGATTVPFLNRGSRGRGARGLGLRRTAGAGSGRACMCTREARLEPLKRECGRRANGGRAGPEVGKLYGEGVGQRGGGPSPSSDDPVPRDWWRSLRPFGRTWRGLLSPSPSVGWGRPPGALAGPGPEASADPRLLEQGSVEGRGIRGPNPPRRRGSALPPLTR